jgi:hypothetical protein
VLGAGDDQFFKAQVAASLPETIEWGGDLLDSRQLVHRSSRRRR